MKKRWWTSISLGLVIVLSQIWMLTQADRLFPVNTELWRTTLIVYISITALVFSVDALRKTEAPLFRVGFLKRFPIFLISALVSGLILFLFGFIIKGNSLPTIREAITGIKIGVLLFHAFIVSIDEELIFRGFVVNEMRAFGMGKSAVYVIHAIIFAVFHYALAGGELLLLIIYIPLSFVFLYVRDKYSPRTNMANAGVHFAWNVFILGFIRP